MHTRRHFLKASLAAAAVYPLPLAADETLAKTLRIGLITDIHKDLVPDADSRLKTFVDDMNGQKVDAVMQLGDFCTPKPANQGFLDIYSGFQGPRHHVIGNHDTDGGFRREQTLAFWGMKARYQSFDLGGFHFVILDANDRPEGWTKGYPHFIAADQVEWLRADLEATRLNTFIFSHQSLEHPECVTNQDEIRKIIEEARMPDGKCKVAACLNGHWHIDHQRVINGVPYIHVNSASYYYMGTTHMKDHVDKELAKTHPLFAWNAGYRKPLYTVLEISPAERRFRILGHDSEWIGPSPQSVGYTSESVKPEWITSRISQRDGMLPG